MTPEQYCQDKAAKSGSSFYYSFLFLPENQRKAMTALYAFCREVDDVTDADHDAGIIQIKLQWWREEIHHLFQGHAQHPVTQALTPVINEFELPEEQFQEIIDGMEMDLEHTRYETFADLSLYCYRVASVVGLLSAEIFGYSNRQTTKYAHDLGMAFQLTNIIRDVREDAMRGRIYIPIEDLKRFSVSTEDVLQARHSNEFCELMKFQAQRAQQYYLKAFQQLPDDDRYQQRCGIIMAAIYQALLKKIEASNFQVLDQRISLTPFGKLWIAWRTRRQERKRHRRWIAKHATA